MCKHHSKAKGKHMFPNCLFLKTTEYSCCSVKQGLITMLLLRAWMNLPYGIMEEEQKGSLFIPFWLRHRFQVKSHKILLYVQFSSGLGLSFVILIAQTIKLNWPLITVVSTSVAFPVMSFLFSRCTKSFWQLTRNSKTSAAWSEHNFLVVST